MCAQFVLSVVFSKANQAQINESTIAALVWQMSGAVSALHEHKARHAGEQQGDRYSKRIANVQ